MSGGTVRLWPPSPHDVFTESAAESLVGQTFNGGTSRVTAAELTADGAIDITFEAAS